MTTMHRLRTGALALPETEEGTHFGMPAFSVRGKGFVSLAKDGHVQLRLSAEDAEAALAAHPGAEPVVRAGTPIGVRLPLADVDGKDLDALVRSAWSSRAPKRLVAALDEAGAAAASGDLPGGIGRPATRALLGAGIDTLDRVARHSEAELLALHGVGPKAVRVLKEELAGHGLTLRA
ncbi:MmcQ/YjbR family DNA-binding protein [Streptomyces sp. VRA16 Mangrove soil]|uniref:MmcQ/YjbR family DNA-binding protein n=1 Tax=Streptomyces sp. VRA16 Mangrove soil TaxID=2817434 RepID=UPI001A9DB465|nr:MmcQ/YjbR family DNA-binding protein [Streptomyces sp. VRA16 Mangrove soil]MBO1330179.1 MmcQ/YjbR family DNA-binding protein [Streptomyces sp. VRA16 Mangrove soil]